MKVNSAAFEGLNLSQATMGATVRVLDSGVYFISFEIVNKISDSVFNFSNEDAGSIIEYIENVRKTVNSEFVDCLLGQD